ncbi:hypothetical protein PIN31115_04526 [Pandoraea iniqua]|uniref:Uncharacterized protein n=1 Tax=Pandoraea iniqua TaxID=2508288 RepID=A0A5E4YIA5_9BURK|nr:hypothetical protein PIN31115_04526 [Pandoraea iniqua]
MHNLRSGFINQFRLIRQSDGATILPFAIKIAHTR